MIRNYSFGKEKDSLNDFFYVYSPICNKFPVFKTESDCIKNAVGEAENDYEYISILTKERYPRGTKITTTCSFESFGAPLIVVSDDIKFDGEVNRYGHHFEAVAYEEGCNLWRIVPWPERTRRPIYTVRAFYLPQAVASNSKIKLSVEIGDTTVNVTLNGESFVYETPEIPEKFHVGITACEGINRFYDLSIDTGER